MNLLSNSCQQTGKKSKNRKKLTQTTALTLTDTVMQTNKTKLTRNVILTLTDTVTVIFFTRISLTSINS